MASKKFVVKNGLLTEQDVIIGSTTDTGERLQVTGSALVTGDTVITQATGSTFSLEVKNTAGYLNTPKLAKFQGDSDSLEITNPFQGAYKLVNSQQDNGIIFYDSTAGLKFLYSNTVKFEITSTQIDFKSDPTVNSYTIWHENNDGSGSGLDADVLDGLQASQFLRSDVDDTMNANLIITGDLTVNGTTTTLNTQNVLIEDNILTLNSNHTGAPSANAGWEVNRGTSANSSVLWDESNDWFKLISAGTDLGRIITTADEGSGNGFDSDTVDGLEADQFLRSDADDTATGNITIEQTLTIGDGSTGAFIYMDGVGNNGTLYSNNGEIGFLDQTLAYGAKLDANNNWIVSANTVAKVFIDADNNSYYGDFAGISEMNNIRLAGSIGGTGTANTEYITFSSNTVRTYINNIESWNVGLTENVSGVIIKAPAYYDSNDINYFLDPAGNSELNTILLEGSLVHRGDTDTYINFPAEDEIHFVTGGVSRFNVSNNGVQFTATVLLDDYITHNGDTDTRFGFSANDTFVVETGGAARLTVTDGAVTASVDSVAPRFVDSANTSYYVDPFGSSGVSAVLGGQVLGDDGTSSFPGFSFKDGTTTGMYRSSADVLALATGGVNRFIFGTTGSTSVNQSFLPIRASTYYPDAGTTRFLSLGETGANTALAVAGVIRNGVDGDLDGLTSGTGGVTLQPYTWGGGTGNPSIQVAGNNGGKPLFTLNRIDAGANPYSASNRFINAQIDGSDIYYLSGSNAGDAYIIMQQDGSWNIGDQSANIAFSVNANTAVTVVGDQSPAYTQGDMTPIIGSNTDSKLHVNGSVQLNSNDDAYVVGRSTASFFKNNELGFGQGGGWYMDNANDMKVRNNKNIITTGTLTGSKFIDGDDSNYEVDPNGTSIMASISLDDYVSHNGDTDSKFGFPANDQFDVELNGGIKLHLENTYAEFTQNVRAPAVYDQANQNYYWNPNSSNSHVFATPTGTLEIGSKTTDYSQFITDRAKFYFNKRTEFNGGIYAYDANDNAFFNIYYDWADTDYYGDFAGTSKFRKLDFDNLNVGAPTATDAVTSARINLFPTVANGNDYTIGVESGAMWFNSDDKFKFYTDGAFHTDLNASFISHETSIRSPIYYDKDNTSWYLDPSSNSNLNIVQVKKLEIDSTATFIDSAAGNYGSIRVEGDTGGMAGYVINTDWGFVANTTNWGIFNDQDNEWAIYGDRNGTVELYYDGTKEFETGNGKVVATNKIESPIFMDVNDNSFYIHGDDQSRLKALNIGNQSALQAGTTYPFTLHHNTEYMIGFRNSGADPNYPWFKHITRNSLSAVSFEFNGIGERFWFNEAGDIQAYGAGIFGSLALNGGNEDVGLLKTYGAGLADQLLFDASEYWDKRVIQPMQGAENGATSDTNEYVENGDGPFAAGWHLQTNGYRTFDSDYIPVEPGEEIYGEIAVKYISGSGGVVYMGIRRYDKDKNPIATNDGIQYFVVNGTNVTSTSWTVYSGHTTIPTSHTPFNGSDGLGVRYIRLVLLMNYSTGGALRAYGPPLLKRTNVLSNLQTQDLDVDGPIVATGDITGNELYIKKIYDKDNTTYYMDPATGGKLAGTWNFTNGDINDVNNITFNDPGPNEGLYWKGGSAWRIFESPDDITTNSGGNLQFTTGIGATQVIRATMGSNGDLDVGRYVTAQRFIDANDTNYYVDPASNTILNNVYINEYLYHNGDTNTYLRYRNDHVHMVAGGQTMFEMDHANDPGVLYFATSSTFTDSSGNMTIGAALDVGTTGTFGSTVTATQFIDADDAAYYVDPNGLSIFETVRAGRYQLVGTTYYIDTVSGDYGSIRVQGNTNGYAGYAINDDWVFMSSGAAVSGIYNDTNNEWAAIFRQNAEVELMHNGTMKLETKSDGITVDGIAYVNSITDRNNSAYFVDPNVDARLLNLTVDNAITTPGVNGYSDALKSRDNRTISPSEDTAGELKFGFTSWNNNNTSPYADYLHLRSYTDASGGNDNLLMFNKSGRGMRLWQQTFGSTTAYSAFSSIAVYGVNVQENFYASIYYDADNTAYYGNFNGTSKMSQVQIDNGLFMQSGSIITLQAATTQNQRGFIQVTDTNDAHLIIATSSGEDISFRDGGVGGDWNMIIRGNGQTLINSRLDTPIMYDRNDTNFYVNPAGSSLINTLVVDDYIQFDDSVATDDGRGVYFHPTKSTAYAIFRESGAWSNPYPDLRIAFHTGLKFGANSGYQGMRFYTDYDMATQVMSINNGSDPLGGSNVYVNNNLQAGASLRAPIFYDSNDTGYYTNPNGTSSMVTVTLDRLNMRDRGDFITMYGNDSDYHGFTSRDNGGGISDDIRINSYHDVFINLDSNNNNDSNTTGFYVGQHGAATGGISGWYFQAMADGNSYASSSFRAPIFYDTNNTGYYVDPASFSNFNTGLRATNIYARDWFRNDQSGEGLYNQGTGQHWYSDNDDYWNVAGGSAANGIRFRDEYGGTVRGYVYADNGNNVGILNSGGSWRMRIVGGDYGLFDGSSVRGQIFYDTNNTAYRFNGASTNDTRFRGVQPETMAYMQLPGHTRSSKEYYAARPRITSNSDYWTGAVGWGTIDLNTVGNWGSGFFDTWSNPANQPSGTSHWVGVQAYHYTNGSNRYGWQMCGGPIGNLRFRNTWGSSFSAWRTVPMLDVNSTSGGSLYAGRYYDSNDSAYYTDPASTSRMNQIDLNFLQFNDGWDIYDDDADTLSIRSNNSDHGEVRFRDSNTYCGRIYWDDDGSIMSLYHDNGEAILYADEDYITYLYYNGTWEGRTRSGYFEARGSFRAPIFYDQNDTTYYLDPAGGSNFGTSVRANEFYARNWFRNDNSGEGIYNQASGQHFYSDDDDGWNVAGGTAANWIRMRDEYAGTVRGYFYADSSNNVGILNNGGTWRMRIVSGDYGLFDGSSVRAPLFYDSNDTTYYQNPAGTSVMNAIQAYGTIQTEGEVTGFANYSDIRWKENIEVIKDAIEKIQTLDGITFNYIDKEGNQTGVIAQQVEKVLPEAVYETTDLKTQKDRKAVRYGNMVGLLIEGIKEQQETINKQQNQLDEQQKQIDKLQELVYKLMDK
jgi:hypothetical protein